MPKVDSDSKTADKGVGGDENEMNSALIDSDEESSEPPSPAKTKSELKAEREAREALVRHKNEEEEKHKILTKLHNDYKNQARVIQSHIAELRDANKCHTKMDEIDYKLDMMRADIMTYQSDVEYRFTMVHKQIEQ